MIQFDLWLNVHWTMAYGTHLKFDENSGASAFNCQVQTILLITES